ncbi:MAG: hypothetical protein A3C71_01055 [Candidatus Yanofskybacteria bacterium RIFCSPHIGHO2_02_FULL_43_15c]|uniref:Uncharacterized protein n=1 Tax=Candidatus Yanofskybacteria bacterium RIFCSPHIGHO2_02_FULL_43_15c TaxID=1802679 RepID=A0A1F8FKK9_9BACT|nr:MAG: hypothetical protein A3C71_01055 [Candidatus Yanofskybacteria bacterium RIFCSPHIGHO2_02_FULL_43_15c]
MSDKGKIYLVLIIFGVALALYLITASSRGRFPFSKNIISSPAPMVTPIPTPDETLNWKTYRNEKYGFEIKAPKFIVENDDLSYVRLSNFIGPTEGIDEGEYLIEVFLYNKNQVSSCGVQVGRENPVSMGTYTGYKGRSMGEVLCLENSDKQILISVISSGLGDISSQILSTFKFIEPNQSGQPCIQVITPARNPETGEIRDFPTPCDVPLSWEKI